MSIKEKARELLEGEVDGVLGYRLAGGSHLPHLFTAADIEEMAGDYPAGERYPLASIVRRLQAADPGIRIAVVARGCDERSLVELFKQGQVNLGRTVILGLACEEELARGCGCAVPYPSEILEGRRVEGVPDDSLVEKMDGMPAEDRLDFWLSRFGSCVKCYGCRNVCPLCYCKECALDDAEMVERGRVPPAQPAFHLIRAIDMAGRCIDCGLCEEACPMGIPLRTLYRKVGRVVEDNLGYRPGRSPEEKSPLAVLGTEKDLE
ncbi:MAG: 4Fe-4S dicluster domain-containing protein [Actinobacteria bacterium]|nr:4Fe-4S dicluster domain-containing protein [Actinomycetota bacterium]